MDSQNSKTNVINLKQKFVERQTSQIDSKGRLLFNPSTRVVSITSGKGGVGKTNIVANLGMAFSKMGKKVLIFDADLGLGNLDILLGLAPKYNLSQAIGGLKPLEEIVIEGPGGIYILPASSGIEEFARLSQGQQEDIVSALNTILQDYDMLLIDTAAGISPDVMHFNAAAQEVVVVASPEPTSITDAYALMKVLSIKYDTRHFKLLINLVADESEAKTVFRQLQLVTDRFLDISITYLGHIQFDKNVTRSVKYQKAVTELFPRTAASRCFKTIAQNIINASLDNRVNIKEKKLLNPFNHNDSE